MIGARITGTRPLRLGAQGLLTPIDILEDSPA
jgi:hypothetical protein